METRGNPPGPLIQVPTLLIAQAVPRALLGQTMGWGLQDWPCPHFCLSYSGAATAEAPSPWGTLMLVWVSEEAPAFDTQGCL